MESVKSYCNCMESVKSYCNCMAVAFVIPEAGGLPETAGFVLTEAEREPHDLRVQGEEIKMTQDNTMLFLECHFIVCLVNIWCALTVVFWGRIWT